MSPDGENTLLGHSGRVPMHRSREAYRILIAAHQGMIEQNASGRYIICGQVRPDFKVRKDLEMRGFLQFIHEFGHAGQRHPLNRKACYRLTAKGQQLLLALDKEAHSHVIA